jgi:hypothetical protein
MLIQVKMEGWSSKDVSDWLQTECKIDVQQAKIFVEENIDGQVLPDVTLDMLKSDPFNLKIGDAMRIIKRIRLFQNVSGKALSVFAFNRSPCCDNLVRVRMRML